MSAVALPRLTADLKRLVLLGEAGTFTDGQLLEWYLASREGAPFAALVKRHGPMVLGVCRRVLRQTQDAEDAFQATFLVLVRKGGSIRPPEMVGNWLHGVAYRTALQARAAIARRRAKEAQVTTMSHAEIAAGADWQEVRDLLDREVQQLPSKLRAAIVLCDLESRSRCDAARVLGIPEGTVSSRLAAGRKLLARNLTRRGVAVSGTLLAATLAAQEVSAAVPVALTSATCALGQFPGAASAKVATLAGAVIKTVWWTKSRVMLGGLLLLAVVVSSAGALVGRANEAVEPAPAPQVKARSSAAATPAAAAVVPAPLAQQIKAEAPGAAKQSARDDDDQEGDFREVAGVVRAVDAAGPKVTLTVNRKGKVSEQVFPLSSNIKVRLGGKVGTLADVREGMQVSLIFARGNRAAVAIEYYVGRDKGQPKEK
jgi:RNA polymerase sigma factor (sigma-70 family)